MKILLFLMFVGTLFFGKPKDISVSNPNYQNTQICNDGVVPPGPDCYTISSGNFNDTAVWFNGLVPGTTNKCTISANNVVTLTQNQRCRVFDFGSQGKLVMGTFTLFVDGD